MKPWAKNREVSLPYGFVKVAQLPLEQRCFGTDEDRSPVRADLQFFDVVEFAVVSAGFGDELRQFGIPNERLQAGSESLCTDLVRVSAERSRVVAELYCEIPERRNYAERAHEFRYRADRVPIHLVSTAAQRIGLQLQQTALTVNAMPQSPDARMLPNSEPSSCLVSAASPLVGRPLG
jgi:hypothetical protein